MSIENLQEKRQRRCDDGHHDGDGVAPHEEQADPAKRQHVLAPVHDLHLRQRAPGHLRGDAFDELLVRVVRIAEVERAFAHLDGEDEQKAQKRQPCHRDGRSVQREGRRAVKRPR